MGRPSRNSQGGYIYHVKCSGLKVKPIFRSEEDYLEFEVAMREAVERFEPRLLAYCVLPKHWHMILTPRKDGDLSKIIAWLTTTHSARWHAKPKRAGTGGLYERRFKSFPVQDDVSLLDVMRFVESHPKRTELVALAQEWRWSSAYHRLHVGQEQTCLSSPPIALPADWNSQINEPTSNETSERILKSIVRSCPFGTMAWVQKTATRLGLESTLRPRGRPKKTESS